MMRYVDAGGARLSVIGLGTWQFGSRDWGYGTDYAERTALDITRRALDVGINLFDTAEIYGFGRSERILGRALGDRRGEAFIATKITPIFPVAPVVEQRARASLRRLGTDRIDLYQVHAPNPLVSQEATMAGMRRLLDRGLIRHVGVSNYSLARWMAADRALGAPVLSNQVSFSLVDRRPLADLVPFAAREGRVVIAYSPLAQGLLGGRYDAHHRPTGPARRLNPVFLPEALDSAAPLLDALRQIAQSHQCTPAQVGLAWVIRHPNVVAIPGASSVEQVEANAAAAEVALSDGEAAQLEEAAARLRIPPRVAVVREVVGPVTRAIRDRYRRTAT